MPEIIEVPIGSLWYFSGKNIRGILLVTSFVERIYHAQSDCMQVVFNGDVTEAYFEHYSKKDVGCASGDIPAQLVRVA